MVTNARQPAQAFEQAGPERGTRVGELGLHQQDTAAIETGLEEGDVVVTECAAICAYLADMFPDRGLAPPSGNQMRGPYYRWLFFAAGPLEAAASNKAFGFEVPAERLAFRKEGGSWHGHFRIMAVLRSPTRGILRD